MSCQCYVRIALSNIVTGAQCFISKIYLMCFILTLIKGIFKSQIKLSSGKAILKSKIKHPVIHIKSLNMTSHEPKPASQCSSGDYLAKWPMARLSNLPIRE